MLMNNGHTRKSPKFLFVLTFIFSIMCGLCFGNNVFAAKYIEGGFILRRYYYPPTKSTTIEVTDTRTNTTTNFGVPGNIGEDLMEAKKVQDKTYLAIYEQTSYGRGNLMLCYELRKDPFSALPAERKEDCVYNIKNTTTASSSTNKNTNTASSSTNKNTNTASSTNTAANTNTASNTNTSANTATNTATNTNKNKAATTSSTTTVIKNSAANTPVEEAGASGPSGSVKSDICKQNNIPEAVKLANGCTVTSEDGKSKTKASDLQEIILGIVSGVIGVLGVVCVVVIIYGGTRYMTSAGEQEKIKKAKNTILYAAIGLAVCALSFAITNFVVAVLNGEDVSSSSEQSSDDSKNSNSGSKNNKNNNGGKDNDSSNNEDDGGEELETVINDIIANPRLKADNGSFYVYVNDGSIMVIEKQGIRRIVGSFSSLEYLSIDNNNVITAASLGETLYIYPEVKYGKIILVKIESCHDGVCTIMENELTSDSFLDNATEAVTSTIDKIDDIFTSPKLEASKGDLHVYVGEDGSTMAIEKQGLKKIIGFSSLEYLDIDDNNVITAASLGETFHIYPEVKNGKILVKIESCHDGVCKVI